MHEGRRIMSSRAVALMTTNQIGTIRPTNGLGFGYGFETTDRYGARDFEASARSAGAARTAPPTASSPRRDWCWC